MREEPPTPDRIISRVGGRFAALVAAGLLATIASPAQTVHASPLKAPVSPPSVGQSVLASEGPRVATPTAQSLILVPTSLAFGWLRPGDAQIPRQVVVRAGSDTLPAPTFYNQTITGPDAGDFYLTENVCIGQQPSCYLYVVFSPSSRVAGTRAASLLFFDDLPDSPQTVTLSGGVTSVGISVNPKQFNLGNVPTGTTTAPQTVTLSSNGTSPLYVSRAFFDHNPPEYKITSDLCTGKTVAPGSSCTISFTYSPLSPFPRNDELWILHDAGPSCAPLYVESCSVVRSSASPVGPWVGVFLFPYEFRGINVGTTRTSKIALSNLGNGDLVVRAVGITGPDSANFTIASQNCTTAPVRPDSSCDVYVTAAPTAVKSYGANLVFTDNTTTNDLIPLSMRGVNSSGTLSATSLDFGTVGLLTTTMRSFAITSNGPDPLSVRTITLSGANAIDFWLQNSCGDIAPNTSCTVTVAFSPRATGGTSRTATLTIQDSTGSRAVSLQGSVTGPSFAFSPSTLAFGIVTHGSPVTLIETVTNNGNEPMTILRITSNPEYKVSADGCTKVTVNVGQSCSFSVSLDPCCNSDRSAIVTIDAGLASASIPTTATGLAPYVPAVFLRFPDTPFRTASASQTFTFGNQGGADWKVTSISPVDTTNFSVVTGTDKCSGSVVPPGGTCSIGFVFSPTLPRPWESLMNINSNASLWPGDFKLEGTGIAPWAGMAPGFRFDARALGSSSTLLIPVRNIGTSSLHVTGVSFSSTPAGFSLDSQTCQNVPRSGPCNLIVRFAPSSNGPANSTMTLIDDELAPHSFNLSGYGGPPNVTAVIVNSGPTRGGTNVTIKGIGFTGVTAVNFGATPAAGFTFVSETQIAAVSPAHAAGVVDVTVTTSGGTSAATLADQFTYAQWSWYFQWFDMASPGMVNDNIHLLNSSTATANITVTMPGANAISVALAAGAQTYVSFGAGAIGGPVVVNADQQILASQRVQYYQTFNEVWAQSAAQASTTSYINWYDKASAGMFSDNIHLLNPGTASASVAVSLPGAPTETATVAPGAETYVTFPAGTIGGPVKVNSDQPVLASQRVGYKSSFNEVWAASAAQAGTTSYFNWYDKASPGMSNDNIHLLNPGASSSTVTVSVPGASPRTVTLLAGAQSYVTFPAGTIGGPVTVFSPNGPVLASQRVQYRDSFNEVWAASVALASKTSYLTWYDKASPGMDNDNVHLINPWSVSVSVTVSVAGATKIVTVPASGGTYLNFPGAIGGPVTVSSDQYVLASQRVQYYSSFNEVWAT